MRGPACGPLAYRAKGPTACRCPRAPAQGALSCVVEQRAATSVSLGFVDVLRAKPDLPLVRQTQDGVGLSRSDAFHGQANALSVRKLWRVNRLEDAPLIDRVEVRLHIEHSTSPLHGRRVDAALAIASAAGGRSGPRDDSTGLPCPGRSALLVPLVGAALRRWLRSADRFSEAGMARDRSCEADHDHFSPWRVSPPSAWHPLRRPTPSRPPHERNGHDLEVRPAGRRTHIVRTGRRRGALAVVLPGLD